MIAGLLFIMSALTICCCGNYCGFCDFAIGFDRNEKKMFYDPSDNCGQIDAEINWPFAVHKRLSPI